MIQGACPVKVDARDRAFFRCFPEIAAGGGKVLNMEYTYDLGMTVPNQYADGLAWGCTGYTQAENKSNRDAILYKPRFTYEKTCLIEGHDMNQGCFIRNSFKAGKIYGYQAVTETTDAEALKHKEGDYFPIDKAPGYDWFDSMRLALRANKKTRAGISIVTPWFDEWRNPSSGIMTANFVWGGITKHLWHNYLIVGEEVIAGVPFLVVKPWLGKTWGKKGFGYMSRECFNKAFDIYGTFAATPGPYNPQDVKTIHLELLQLVLVYLNRILTKVKLEVPNYN